MKYRIMFISLSTIRKAIVSFIYLGMLVACQESATKKDQALNITTEAENTSETLPKQNAFNPDSQFNDYWYAGEAEISAYKLEQARYGELREGTAVLVFVTEPFLPKKQVKADGNNPENISVLKLNATKNFNTGIYPYSIMQSTFYPVANNQHAIKVSCSVQEWCGHAYAQLNNREQFELMSHSYFESEADENFKLEKATIENELWAQLRIDPSTLPVG